VAAWTADPSGLLGGGFTDQTFRAILTPHLGGGQVRVHLSNRLGTTPVTFTRSTVALRQAAAAIVPGSSRPLTFGGQAEVTVPPGTEAISDPAPLTIAPFQDLAVSLAFARPTGPATGHLIARQRSYLTASGSGDHTADEGGGAFGGATSTVEYVDAVDVLAPASVGAAALFGDSLTDGYQSAPAGGEDQGGIDANHRYPDYLAHRLSDQPGGPRLSVVNAGISANQLLAGGPQSAGGMSGLSRLDTDVLGVSGVTDAIVLEGINDIAVNATAEQLTTGLAEVVARLHAAGLHVLLATIPPAGTGLLNLGGLVPGAYVDSTANLVRIAVDTWIRSGASGADGVVDFDAVLRGAVQPNELDPGLDSGDHIHPSDPGYTRMADAVDLASLRGSLCVTAARSAARLRVSARSLSGGRLRVAGRLIAGPSPDCAGAHVTVRAVHARHTVLKRTLPLTGACRFAATRPVGAHGAIEVRVGFAGSPTLLPTHARSVYVRAA
jgi:lysophospholipase L1-like esterase